MRLIDYARLSPNRFETLNSLVQSHESLGDVLAWLAAEVSHEQLRELLSRLVVQDEFTMDIVIPRDDGLVIVYDTT